MKVYEIFKKIEATASKNDKVQIIKDNADDKEFVEEVWRDVFGYEGLYQVSSKGRVMSLSRAILTKGGAYRITDNKVLSASVGENGYKKVVLSNNNVKKTFLIHRLVAKAFIPNPNKYSLVNHIDENKENNECKNLEWCNYSYNATHGNAMKKMINSRLNNGGNRAPKHVVGTSIDGEGEDIKVLKLNDVKNYGFHPSAVSLCCNGKRVSHKGYYWEFAQKEEKISTIIKYQVEWKHHQADIHNKHGVFDTFEEAIDSIYEWWETNNFTPPYIRRWTKDGVTTIDYGLHDMFYYIVECIM